jgi:hypothetical protein
MTNRELEQLLKRARVPRQSDQYWQTFPKKIAAKLHWKPAPKRSDAPGNSRFAFASVAVGVACLLLVFVFLGSRLAFRAGAGENNQLAAARKCYQEFESLFPHQLSEIIFDRKGMRMVLADKAELPDAAPIYLRVCGSGSCQAYVTFSGQRIIFNGEDCEVLANGQGGVMLVSENHVWSQDGSSRAVSIQATFL